MMRFLSQMMKLPVTAFVYSMDMLVKTMRGLERIADQGMNLMTDDASQNFGHAPYSQGDLEIGRAHV